MNKDSIDKLVKLRSEMIEKFGRIRDYKTNKNAIMLEIDHAQYLHKVIVCLDDILKDYVEFKN